MKLMLFIFILSSHTFAQDTFIVTEKSLLGLSLDSSPQWDSIEAAFLTSRSESQQLQDKFRPEIFAEGQFAETRERPIIQFIPVWSPTKTAQLGARQAFRGGVSLSAALGTDQRSAMSTAGTFRDVTTTVARLDLQVDLWKDLLGRLSKAQSESANLIQIRAELEKEINRKAFAVSLRRTYWSIVANNEQIKVYDKLKKTALNQLQDSNQRLRAGVTDRGEVARYEAQVASRKGSALYYRYQHEILVKQLKMLLPELKSKEIVLADYDISTMIQNVLGCTEVIASQKKIPFDFTRYDEITELIRKTQKEQIKLATSYDEVDLKFLGTVKSTGVGSHVNSQNKNQGSYGASFDDMENNNRTGYSAGLKLVIPIGKGETRQTQELLAQKKFDYQLGHNDALISNTHNQLVKIISILSDVIVAQKENTEALERRIVIQNRKFKEARLNVNDLIQDQDAYLNSNLNTINTQQEILNIIFDYLVVFTETPCEFNRI
jgi:outer membrane protein TolC